MEPSEVQELARHLVRARVYLEFGSGGSTLVALNAGVQQCYSVDSDAQWIEQLRLDPEIQRAEREGRLTFHVADVGPVGAWGFPTGASNGTWRNYALGVWSVVRRSPDLVLIDGRFRTACGAAALLRCPVGTTFMIHDYDVGEPKRANYLLLANLAEMITVVGSLAVFRKHISFDSDLAADVLEKTAADPW
jgi:hypothetical protein